MSFQPLVPATGLVGWAFLSRTQDAQAAQFATNPENQRDTEYFLENIGLVSSAKDLVSDRRLLRVALGAFGLQDDINSKALIQQVLEGGTSETDSLANRMTDSRYAAISEAFGFDQDVAHTQTSGFAAGIVDKFRTERFETAVGNQDEGMRLALYSQHAFAELAAEDVSDETKWFTLMGDAPMRAVMQTALGLPDSFQQIDIDKQYEIFVDRAQRQLGITELSDLADSQQRENLIEKYLLRAQVAEIQSFSSGSIALTLLQTAVR